MSKKINKLISVTFVLIVVLFLISQKTAIQRLLSNNQLPDIEASPTPSIAPAAQLEFQVSKDENSQTSYQLTATVSSQSALDLVASQLKLDLKEYNFGVMIEGVNGLMADNKHYWAIYQNGEYAQVGISDIKLNSGDQVELKYEEIKF